MMRDQSSSGLAVFSKANFNPVGSFTHAELGQVMAFFFVCVFSWTYPLDFFPAFVILNFLHSRLYMEVL